MRRARNQQAQSMKTLRNFSPACAILALALLAPLAAQADEAPLPESAAPTIRLHADHVAFYYDRFLIEADGNVSVRIGDGVTMTGQTFSMDIKLNRFLLAGAVTVTSPSGSQSGAAVSDFLDFGRIYFVPITSEPDRWTFLDNDFAHPAKGRVMPGDTFAFPDLANDKPYLVANAATIVPHQFVDFHRTVLAVAGKNLTPPLGPYYINFSDNRFLSTNSLTGASYDATWQVAGSKNAISAIHFRYDPTNKAYASFEQHFANPRGYAVFSINPATEDSKYYNLFTGYSITDKLQMSSFTQFHLQQFGFSQPLAGQDVGWIRLTQALPESSVQLVYQQFNLCNTSTYPDTDPGGALLQFCGQGAFRTTNQTHPAQLTLGVTSDENRVGRSPVYYTWDYGIGNIHDAYPLQNFGGASYTTIWNHYIGGTAFLKNVRVGDPSHPYTLGASLTRQRTWYSVPHHVDTTTSLVSLSQSYGPVSDRGKLTAFVSYEVAQTGDYYNGGQQLAYTPFVPVINGTSYPSYLAFQGVATLRTFSLGSTYTPTPYFSATVLARKHRDFPIAEPGEFPQPPVNVLGQPVYGNILGQPPYDVTGTVHVRLTPTLAIDVQRSYYFNFGTRRWSPNFYIQVTQ